MIWRIFFLKCPKLKALENRDLFLKGRLLVFWNDELDIETETIYREGKDVGFAKAPIKQQIAFALHEVRTKKGISQNELASTNPTFPKLKKELPTHRSKH